MINEIESESQTKKAGIYKWVSILCYPLVLLTLATVAYCAVTYQWDYGPTTFFSLLGVVTYFIIMERIIPYKKAWYQTRREWARDGMYFLLVMICGASAQGLIRIGAMSLTVEENGFGLWQNAVAALLITSFIGYWLHRVEHRGGWLWSVHGIHHVPDKVNLTNNGVVHMFEVVLSALLTQLPLVVLGISEAGMFIAGLFTVLQGYFIHANINVNLRPLHWLIATPELHRFHHSNKMVEAGNYGAEVMIWDKLFGTSVWHANQESLQIGVVDPSKFPSPFSIWRGILHPVTYFFRKTTKAPLSTSEPQL